MVKAPTGTIQRTVYDGLGRVSSVWIGTDDSGATDSDPTGSGGSNNMVKVSENQYDNGGIGDSNLTKSTQYPDANPLNARSTVMAYDWRDRVIAQKSGALVGEDTTTHRPITYFTYDNLDEVITQQQYDGDGIMLGGDFSNGALDNTFSDDGKDVVPIASNTIDQANGIAVQSDGKIVIVGRATGDFALLRYNPNGTLDSSFVEPNGSGTGKFTIDLGGVADTAYAVAIDAAGKILVAGVSANDFVLLRLNADGSFDDDFNHSVTPGKVITDIGSSTTDTGRAIAIQSDGKIIVVGSSGSDIALVRYTTNGTLDTTFGTGGKVITDIASSGDDGRAIALQPDDKIVVAGTSNSNFALVRYNSNGTPDSTFGSSGKVTTDIGCSTVDHAYAVAVQPDGRILAVGDTSANGGGTFDFALARYTATGALDTTFNSTGKVTTGLCSSPAAHAYAVVLQPDGKIIAGGDSDTSPVFYLARYNSDGSQDSTFDGDGLLSTQFGVCAGFDHAYAMSLEPGGKLLATGASNNDFATARYTNDGVPDSGQGGLLRAKSTFSYDEQGRVYQNSVFSVNQTSGSISSSSLNTNTWYDHRGNVIKTSSPGGLVVKSGYDGAGRNTIVYQGDGGGDTDWPAANSVSGDAILEQTEMTYDKNGNVTSVLRRQRDHNETNTGALGSQSVTPYARVSTSGYFYDQANRLVASVDVGAIGGVATSAQSTTELIDTTRRTEASDSFIGDILLITSGTDAGQQRTITAFDGSTKKFTVGSAFSVPPTGASYLVIAGGSVPGQATTTGATNSLTDSNRTEPNGSFVGWTLTITSGTGMGQSAKVTAFSSNVFTLAILSTAPDSTSVYSLVPPGGQATSGSSNSLTDSNRSEANGSFVGWTLAITSGTGAGQRAKITGYSSHVFTLGSTVTAPDTSSTYVLLPEGNLTNYGYDSRGMVSDVRDPRGLDAKTLYDAAGRTTNSIQNYLDGTPSNSDDDQTIQYTYDGDDHVLTQKAVLPSSAFQTTQYVYGEATQSVTGITHLSTTATATTSSAHGYKVGETVTISGADQPEYNGTFVITDVPLTNTFKYTITGNPSSSTGIITARRADDVFSNDILTMIKYPDVSTGSASSSTTDQKSLTVDRLGRTKAAADQNGTVHSYAYDSIGRLASDAVTTLGGGVNNSILRLTYLYGPLGGLFQATSYDAASVGNIKNQVQYTYNGLGQLITEYQSQSVAVNTSSSPKVQYAYTEMASGANHSRLTKITYPNTRIVRYEYNSGVDSAVSRVSFLADDSSGSVGTHLEEYSYLGLSTIVQENRPQPGTKLTYISQSSGTGAAGDQYTGLDRFGRVIDQNWYKTSAIDEYKYGYDADSNVLWKENMVSPTNSELYGDQSGHFYDGLNRLQHFQRGSLSGGHDSIQGSAGHSQDFGLDQLGNATSITTDGVTPAQSRPVNQQNEITSISGGFSTPGYDNDGNTTSDEGASPSALTYDAWNRLMSYGGSSETFTYDALGRRITSLVGSTTTHLYYSNQWQVVEERLNSSTSAKTQYVWGLGYVDAMVLRDRDTGSDGVLEERRYSQYDANYNITSITDTSGNVKERYQYDPYGLLTILNGGSDADSGVNDWSADANNTSDWGWVHFHQGGRYDSTTKLYSFRHRDYSPTLQRWMQEDLLEYLDGPDLYRYVNARPVGSADPLGLSAVDPKEFRIHGPAVTWTTDLLTEVAFEKTFTGVPADVQPDWWGLTSYKGDYRQVDGSRNFSETPITICGCPGEQGWITKYGWQIRPDIDIYVQINELVLDPPSRLILANKGVNLTRLDRLIREFNQNTIAHEFQHVNDAIHVLSGNFYVEGEALSCNKSKALVEAIGDFESKLASEKAARWGAKARQTKKMHMTWDPRTDLLYGQIWDVARPLPPNIRMIYDSEPKP